MLARYAPAAQLYGQFEDCGADPVAGPMYAKEFASVFLLLQALHVMSAVALHVLLMKLLPVQDVLQGVQVVDPWLLEKFVPAVQE